jgi:hypothetical protein
MVMMMMSITFAHISSSEHYCSCVKKRPLLSTLQAVNPQQNAAHAVDWPSCSPYKYESYDNQTYTSICGATDTAEEQNKSKTQKGKSECFHVDVFRLSAQLLLALASSRHQAKRFIMLQFMQKAFHCLNPEG